MGKNAESDIKMLYNMLMNNRIDIHPMLCILQFMYC